MTKNKKKKSKIKRWWDKLKRWINYQKTPIRLLVVLLLFPVAVGLIYKIPIALVDIDIGDLLSFYAVALGLFASYLTYRETEDRKVLARQESLMPKIELSLEFDDDEMKTKFCINNTTGNDYVIDYIEYEYYEAEEKRYLNARKQLEFVIDSWAEEYPKDIYIGIKDTDGHEWGVGFEYQPGTIKYCRTFTDPIA